jgi:transcriptional regulator with XRE-family HTH domain
MLGEKLKQLRIIYNLNMKQAASLLQLPYTTYVGYEKNEREPNFDTVKSIAEILDVPVNFLLGLDVFKDWETIYNKRKMIVTSLKESFSLSLDPDDIINLIKIIDTAIYKFEFIEEDIDIYVKDSYKQLTQTQKYKKGVALSYDEVNHLKKYNSLDTYGKEFVDLVIDHELKRCNTLQEQALDESEKKLIKKYRSSDDNTKKIITSIPDMSEEIEVYRAAMSDDDHEDEIVKMSRAEIEKLLSLPDTDEDL